MTNLGQLGCYLGVNFIIFKELVFLFQQLYIEKMLQSFKITNCIPTKVPMVEGTKLESNMNEHKVDSTSYR